MHKAFLTTKLELEVPHLLQCSYPMSFLLTSFEKFVVILPQLYSNRIAQAQVQRIGRASRPLDK